MSKDVTDRPDALPPERLYTPCDTTRFKFTTTADLDELDEIIGQERALAAVRFGIGMRREGYNLYVLGPPGTGKLTAVRQYLEQQVVDAPRPDDWCYVNRFDDPQRPRALRLPAGRGQALRADLARLLEEIRGAIPAAFEGKAYQDAVHQLEEDLKERQEAAFEKLQKEAEKRGLALVRTPGGFLFTPVRDGELLAPEEVENLSRRERERIETDREKLGEQLETLMHEITGWRRETRDRVRDLNDQVTLQALRLLTADLRDAYADLPDVVAHVDALEQDVLEHVDDFRKQEETTLGKMLGAQHEGDPGRRYEVNLVVDHGDDEDGTPVVFEDHPTVHNLIGRIEHVAQMGALSTDFTLIRTGAIHRANGGYLVLDVLRLLSQPYAWDALKRALRARQVRIESLGQMLSLVSTVGLEPEPIPLDLKVVLIGDRLIYYLLCEYDPDFGELFKVAADFEDRIERTADSDLLYARLIGTIAAKEKLHHFDRKAVGRVIEHVARLSGDAERVSTHMRSLADLLREADYWASHAGCDLVGVVHVQQAIDAQRDRSGRIRERIQEAIQRGTVLIDSTGGRAGQVNGLSVLQLGDTAFGQPSRITATARLGEGEVVDIEREVELGGAIHSKGVMILSAYLAARYASELPLSLHATLVFEQSYGGVDGDSASVAELTALLSALADVPVRQSLAVTGSINQHGEVQAIGGVNEKIEGFFEVCQARGLTGEQGVVIPTSNVPHLMLRDDVVEAARNGRFRIWAVERIDQAAALLTGLEAGERDVDGSFPDGSLNARVEARLRELSELRRSFSEHGQEGKDGVGKGRAVNADETPGD
jgi:lon-related putative ATP-dependent protease